MGYVSVVAPTTNQNTSSGTGYVNVTAPAATTSTPQPTPYNFPGLGGALPDQTPQKIASDVSSVWNAPATPSQPLSANNLFKAVYGTDAPTGQNGIVTDTLDAWQKVVEGAQNLPAQTAPETDKIAAIGKVGLNAVSAFFTPFSSALSKIATIPGPAGQLGDFVNKVFSSVGVVGSDVLEHMVNNNTVLSQDQKDKLSPLARGIGALASQIILGKAGADSFRAMKDKTTSFMDVLAEDSRIKELQNNPDLMAGFTKQKGYQNVSPPTETVTPPKRTAPIQESNVAAAPSVSLHQQLMDTYNNAGKGLLSNEVKETGVPTEADNYSDFGETSPPQEKASSRLQQQTEMVDSAPKVQRALDIVKTELALAEPGYRALISEGGHDELNMKRIGVNSTFPSWLPENGRTTAMIQKFLKNLDTSKIEYPPARNTAERAFYNAIWDQVDHYSGLDTKAIRDRIIANEEATPLKGGNGKARGSGSGSGGDVTGGAGEKGSVKVPARQLPVGTGETTASRLEARVTGNLKNLSPDKVDQLGLSTYAKMSKPEQIKAATEYVTKNPSDALRVLKGEIPEPEGILRNSIYVAMDNLSHGDSGLAAKLASLHSTRMGQELSMLTEIDPYSPVTKIREIEQANIKAGGGEKIARTKTAKLTETLKGEKVNLPKEELKWEKFLAEVQC